MILNILSRRIYTGGIFHHCLSNGRPDLNIQVEFVTCVSHSCVADWATNAGVSAGSVRVSVSAV